MTTAIYNSHGLQTHTFHWDLCSQQETMIQIIEKLIPEIENIGIFISKSCYLYRH